MLSEDKEINMNAKNKNRKKTQEMVAIAVFAVLMAICSWICIPTAVPFTMQTFGVFLTVSVLGGKRGTLAIGIYLLLGAIGIPVFSGFGGGVGVLLGTGGGYIVGFLVGAAVMWGLERCFGKKKWARIFQMLCGLLTCYGFGTLWFVILYTRNTGSVGIVSVLSWCVVPFVIPDLIKLWAAFLVGERIKKAHLI